jgi:hypothetical protein
MTGMAKQTGRRSWWVRCWTGACASAAIAWSLGACGESGSSEPPLPPDRATGSAEPDAAAPDEPPPPEGSGGTEGSGFMLPLQPPRMSPVNGACTPGVEQQCLFDQLCVGTQTCALDGSGYGPCTCASVPDDAVAIVGARCASDADCAAGATCFTAGGNDYLGAGGPAGGYCTFACADSAACIAVDPQSLCVPMGPNGSRFCIRACLSKQADPGEAKCLNRADLVCVSVAADGVEALAVDPQPGYCAPRCGSDADCPEGRVCHRQGGICTNVPSPGLPSGSRCELDTNCDGRACEDRIDGVGTCTALCTLGALAGCGYDRDDPARKAACIVPLVSAGGFGEGPGDLGLCRELCSVDSDCLRADEGFVCRRLTPALAEYTGRPGACSLPPPPPPTATPDPTPDPAATDAG